MEQKHSLKGTGDVFCWKEPVRLGWRVCPHFEGFPKEAAFPAVGISSRRGFRQHPTPPHLGTVRWAGKASEKCLLKEEGLVYKATYC